MKAIISCAVVLLMAVISYGVERELYIFTNSGKVTYNLADVDSVAFGKVWAPGDSLIDSRDGQKYATVLIGSQCWMAENLNIGTRIYVTVNQTNNGNIEKYAYDNNESNADTYGGLYQWDEMMQYSTTEGAQGICPSGWHIPSDAEWTTLVDSVGGASVGGTAIKVGGSFGFKALLSGCRGSDGVFYYLGAYEYFWSSTQLDPDYAWYRSVNSDVPNVYRNPSVKPAGLCVRCIRDAD